jgi:uncharacterized YigZ family protein
LFHITKTGLADQTINKSRFVAVAEHCTTEREVMTLLRRLATEHAHANHLVFAYKIQNPQGGYSQRFHDSGEPSGTAGKPILQYIEGRDLVNACVAVIRYFGGVKLGTGGLARAYGGTAKLALDAAVITPFVEMRQMQLVIDYARLDSFIRDLAKLNGQLLNKRFDERVNLSVSVPAHEVEVLKSRYPQT